MSKKKEEPANKTDNLKELLKKYGKVISNGISVLSKKKDLKALTVSPSFDISLNGGLIEGSWCVISGDPKTGKTTLCLQICKNGQKEGRKVIYLDGETRLKGYNLSGIEGLDLEAVDIIHSPEDGPSLAAEDFLNILENMIKMPEYKGSIAVIDSCSSLVPRAELDMEACATIRASLPKLLSHWIKKNAQTIVNQKIILLIITHYVTNTSGYGKIKLPDCGKMIQYQADTLLDVKKSDSWEEGGEEIGRLVEWDIRCSSMGASNKSCKSYIRYGTGVDFVQEIIVIATDLGLIDKSGAWYTCDFMSDAVENYDAANYKFQGQAKLYEYISTHPEVFDILNNKVKEMLV